MEEGSKIKSASMMMTTIKTATKAIYAAKEESGIDTA